MENEIDDQFALTYLIKSLDRFDLKAITIAPFSGSKYAMAVSTLESITLSYNTTLKILDMLNYNHHDIVYKGSTNYMQNGYDEVNDAVKKIIDASHENDHVYVIAIGAITNVAMALKHDPSIINKIEVIWLGGNSFLYSKNDEFNFRQDIMAVREVFNSGVKLTVIPCRNVAANLTTTIYELEHYLLDKGEIGKYLCTIFDRCKKRETGMSKTIWDISAIAYLINKTWFEEDIINAPGIGEDGSYIMNQYDHKVTFVKDLRRNHIYKDFFTKMGVK
jgi:inosine-uridine nucleoside N-ribohydrolase